MLCESASKADGTREIFTHGMWSKLVWLVGWLRLAVRSPSQGKLQFLIFNYETFPRLSMCHNNERLRLGYTRNCRFRELNSTFFLSLCDLLRNFSNYRLSTAKDQPGRDIKIPSGEIDYR
jgi:hypothetical protein